MNGPLLDFLRAARGAGLRISPAESLDALRAVAVVGFADRATLREALGLVLAKSVEEKRAFAVCFDRFFSRGAFDVAPPLAEPTARSALGRMIEAGDQAGLAAAVEAAAAEVGLVNIALFTQVNLYTRRILERLGLAALEHEIAQSPAPEALRQGLVRLREQVKGFVQQSLTLFAEGQNRAFRERLLTQARLTSIDRRDHDRMRILVRAMAKRLATQYGRRRKRDRRGVLDTRRTLRRNLGWGGVPFVTVWKQQRIDKPKLVVLCDVSGSVAAFAQFLLLFLYSLNEALSGLRAFAFSGRMVDVSEILERHPIERAIPLVMERAGFGSSNYGAALVDFEREHLNLLDRQTTVIILGDARGNRNDPQVAVLRRMADRARQLVWLNPEVRAVWGSGDSDMLRYAPHCRVTAVCNSLQQLDRVIGDLLKDGA